MYSFNQLWIIHTKEWEHGTDHVKMAASMNIIYIFVWNAFSAALFSLNIYFPNYVLLSLIFKLILIP